jgi:hypothetical protein
MSMKNSNDTIGNRTRDLPTCTAVPQPLNKILIAVQQKLQPRHLGTDIFHLHTIPPANDSVLSDLQMSVTKEFHMAYKFVIRKNRLVAIIAGNSSPNDYHPFPALGQKMAAIYLKKITSWAQLRHDG